MKGTGEVNISDPTIYQLHVTCVLYHAPSACLNSESLFTQL
jgi:hypothetical protein